jgi:hypothetical protein
MARFNTGFASPVARAVGPRVVAQLSIYGKTGEVFRTDDLANALDLEPNTTERHFVTQFLRRLDRAKIIENTSVGKRKYKEYRVVRPEALEVFPGGGAGKKGRKASSAPRPDGDIAEPQYKGWDRRAEPVSMEGAPVNGGHVYLVSRINHVELQIMKLHSKLDRLYEAVRALGDEA